MPIHSLLIKPAGPDCNLRCQYCFYAAAGAHFAPGPHRMSPAVLESALRGYLPHALGGASIGFQGGEPTLMGLGFFKDALRLARSLTPARAPFSWALQTNGTLLDTEWAAFAADAQMLLGVSLDGPRDVHDAMRPASYDRVTASLKLLIAAKAQFNTLTVVSSANAGMPGAVWDTLLEAGSAHMQFIPCLRSPLSPNPLAWADFLMEAFERWQAAWPRIYVRNFDEMLLSFAYYREAGCQTSPHCAMNLVIEHDGGVFPCDFFVEPPLKLGNVLEGDLLGMSESGAARAFVTAKANLNEQCRACKWRSICHGHCPAYRDEGGTHALCEGYQRFFAFAQPRVLEMKRKLIAAGRLREEAAPLSRNAPCPCGSGRKFKQCCYDIKKV